MTIGTARCHGAEQSIPTARIGCALAILSARSGEPGRFGIIPPVVAALMLALAALDAQTPAARRVAITIDDGPVVGEMTDLATSSGSPMGWWDRSRSRRFPSRSSSTSAS